MSTRGPPSGLSRLSCGAPENEAACPCVDDSPPRGKFASSQFEGSIASYIKALGHHPVCVWYHIRLRVRSLQLSRWRLDGRLVFRDNTEACTPHRLHKANRTLTGSSHRYT